MSTEEYLITLMVVCFLLGTVIVFTRSFVKYGLRYLWSKQKFKDSCGQIIMRNKSGNFTFRDIIFVDLSAQYKETKKGQYYYSREQFSSCQFFGLPTVFLNSEDTKTTIGLYQAVIAKVKEKIGLKAPDARIIPIYQLYSQENRIDGTPETESIETTIEGKNYKINTDIAKLTAIKPSVTLVPSIVQAVVLQVALTKAIEDFFKKYQMLLIICGAAAIGGAASAYLGYVAGNTLAAHTESLNQILSLCGRALNTTVIPG